MAREARPLTHRRGVDVVVDSVGEATWDQSLRALARKGRLVTCEHGARRVTRTEHDGSITVLADRYKGKRLNSPNDVVVKSDGSIWFTDPPYGIMHDYEGHKADSEIGANYVYLGLNLGKLGRHIRCCGHGPHAETGVVDVFT